MAQRIDPLVFPAGHPDRVKFTKADNVGGKIFKPNPLKQTHTQTVTPDGFCLRNARTLQKQFTISTLLQFYLIFVIDQAIICHMPSKAQMILSASAWGSAWCKFHHHRLCVDVCIPSAALKQAMESTCTCVEWVFQTDSRKLYKQNSKSMSVLSRCMLLIFIFTLYIQANLATDVLKFLSGTKSPTAKGWILHCQDMKQWNLENPFTY